MEKQDHASGCGATWMMVVTLMFALLSAGAMADPPPRTERSLDTITVEGRRQREAIKREVNTFINSITVHSLDESVARWKSPICPLVAGLPHDMGEFALRRMSLTVKNADAPLAGEKCDPNFFVVVTAQPDVLLKKWRARDRLMFNDERGLPGIRRFLASSQAIRVWYNAGAGCGSDIIADLGLLSPGLAGASAGP